MLEVVGGLVWVMRPSAIRGVHAVAYYDALVPDPLVPPRPSQMEDYYLDTGERPGVRWGQAAGELGLAGEADRRDFRLLLAGLDPGSGLPLRRRLRVDGVRGFDLTFSAPKSVSVLSAVCGGAVEREIIAAHDAAVKAVMRVIEERATTRRGTDGVVRVDVAGVATVLVRHRTSRALDPQLHTHAVLASKVKSVDGVWRALDASMLYRDQRMFGGLYQAALRAELTGRLGVGWGPVIKGQAEIAGMPRELLEAFSRRAAQIRNVVDAEAQAFRAENGREPSRRESAIIVRDAARESRPPKQHGRSSDRLRADWLATARRYGYEPDRVLKAAIAEGESAGAIRARRWVLGAAGRALRPDEHAHGHLAEGVLRALGLLGSAWTRADVEREVAARLPTVQGAGGIDQVREIQRAADQLINSACVDLAPGMRGAARAILDEHGVQRYSTPALVEQEQRVVRWLTELAAQPGQPVALDHRVASVLDPEQAHAAALVAGTNRLVVVVGPAGTGKTRAVGAAATALYKQGRVALGLAPSAAAAEQLQTAAEFGTETVARFLTAHQLPGGHHGPLDLPTGATLIVDEAGMLSTDDTEQLLAVAQARGYRLALIGDSRQLAAVGRGGMFEHARAIGPTSQLAEVRRFSQAWEAQASLLLRQCEPDALDLYQQHDRIRSGTLEQMHAAILEHWWQHAQDGHSVAFTVASNDQARTLNHHARRRLVDAGTVDDRHAITTSRGERVGVGDQIQTRQNQRMLKTDTARWVKNRQQWHVQHIHPDGSLQVRGPSGQVTLPADYAREQVQLAYFQTVHSTQGLTRDHAATLIDELAGWRSVYVGLTRGRHSNTAYVIVNDPDDNARRVFERALRRDRADLGALAIARQLAADARRVIQRRVQALEAERHRLIASDNEQAQGRLRAIGQEIQQLTSMRPSRAVPRPTSQLVRRSGPTIRR